MQVVQMTATEDNAMASKEEVEYEQNNQKNNFKSGFIAKMGSTKNCVWNSSKKEFIGRTWQSWAKIGLFYLVFYAALACFFAIMLAGFFSTLDPKAPTQKRLYSLIKANPGMGFRPMKTIETTLIHFRQGVNDSYHPFKESIDSFLNAYKNQDGPNVKDCTGPSPDTKGADDVCKFDLKLLGDECTSDKHYGYDEGQPCVLLKINKVYDWMPTPFNVSDTRHPLLKEAKEKLGTRMTTDYVGISCDGENEADADNLGPVKYYPENGFSYSFFPYLGQENYKPPVVFARFLRPRPGALIQVWCKLWTSNIKHHKNDKAGSIHFELLVDG